MKCLKREIIIRYINNELENIERGNVEQHIADCEKCRSAVNKMKEKIDFLRKDIALLNPEKITVPSFEYPAETREEYIIEKNKPKFLRRYLFPAAAVLVILIFIFIKQDTINGEIDFNHIEAVLNAEGETLFPDINAWWFEERLDITIIDVKKRTVEKITAFEKKENFNVSTYSF